jgi:hypothetical protein
MSMKPVRDILHITVAQARVEININHTTMRLTQEEAHTIAADLTRAAQMAGEDERQERLAEISAARTRLAEAKADVAALEVKPMPTGVDLEPSQDMGQ